MRHMINSYYYTKVTHEEALLPSPSATIQPRSPWHSPVPYLFGGLAAMLGLIVFALLILACSYWRLSGDFHDSERGDDQRDIESGNGKEDGSGKTEKVYEEKILVIMAGQEKPTFLATPVSGRAFSFADKTATTEHKEAETAAQNSDKVKEEMSNDSESTTVITTQVEENTETRAAR